MASPSASRYKNKKWNLENSLPSDGAEFKIPHTHLLKTTMDIEALLRKKTNKQTKILLVFHTLI